MNNGFDLHEGADCEAWSTGGIGEYTGKSRCGGANTFSRRLFYALVQGAYSMQHFRKKNQREIISKSKYPKVC